MLLWSHALLMILTLAPCIWGRHIGHRYAKRSARRYEEVEDEDPQPVLRSHLNMLARLPSALNLTEGDRRVLECQAGGSPGPHIYWLKNGQPLSQLDSEPPSDLESGQLDIESVGGRLLIDCVTSADDGDQYSCVAESARHREVSTTTLRVAPSHTRSCSHRHGRGRKPRIAMWTRTLLENQGEDARLTCRPAHARPQPTVMWLDNGGMPVQPNSDKYKILSNGDLVIRNLEWSDMGNYVCIAENSHGSARVEVFVYPVKLES